MSLYRFTVSRRSVVTEHFTVEADSEEQALEIANNGEIDYDNNAAGQSFEDWYEDEFQVTSFEIIDPLMKMVKEYEAA